MSVRVAAENALRRQQRRVAGRARRTVKLVDEARRDTGHALRHLYEAVRDLMVNLARRVIRRSGPMR